jgi:hypothetical protein
MPRQRSFAIFQGPVVADFRQCDSSPWHVRVLAYDPLSDQWRPIWSDAGPMAVIVVRASTMLDRLTAADINVTWEDTTPALG